MGATGGGVVLFVDIFQISLTSIDLFQQKKDFLTFLTFCVAAGMVCEKNENRMIWQWDWSVR